MRAVTWQGKRKVSVDTVADPRIEHPTDAIIRVTTTNICGSDLHLYETLGPFMEEGDILGHEPMGIVEEVGTEAGDLKVGDRVVIPFQISCGNCFMCNMQLYTQCETTQVREQGMGAALFGFSKLYGEVPGGQAEYLRVPFAHPMRVRSFRALSIAFTCVWFASAMLAVGQGLNADYIAKSGLIVSAAYFIVLSLWRFRFR